MAHRAVAAMVPDPASAGEPVPVQEQDHKEESPEPEQPEAAGKVSPVPEGSHRAPERSEEPETAEAPAKDTESEAVGSA